MNDLVDDLDAMPKAGIARFRVVPRREIDDLIDERVAARPRTT